MLVLALFGATTQASARQSGANLLVNGDAESGITGWTFTGGFTSLAYGSPGGFPDASQAAPGGGGHFFAGGAGQSISTATQKVDVTSMSAPIDAGQVTATISAALGGWESQPDSARVTVSFLNVAGTPIGSDLELAPVTVAERAGKTGFLTRSNSLRVPPETETVRVVITQTRASGNYNDGYADNLSLTLTVGAAPPGRKALTIVSFKNRYKPRTAAIADGGLMTICNKNDWSIEPFAFGSNRFHVKLKKGSCFSKRMVNPTADALQVKIYDALHSQARMVLTVLPRGS